MSAPMRCREDRGGAGARTFPPVAAVLAHGACHTESCR
jgi:hypothetical protein